MKKQNAGFTLIELIIVVAIVAILATAAYTTYSRYAHRAQRNNAQAALTELANFMERYHSNQGNYKGAQLPFNALPRRATGDDVYYNVTVSIGEKGQTYTLTATPANAQSGDSCGTLTLNQTGKTTAQGSDCW